MSGLVWFVSRHDGAVAWVKTQDIHVDHWVKHLDVCAIHAGDTVIGTLPINLAAQVCARGAFYRHLSLEISAEWRGRELSMQKLMEFSAKLQSFHVTTIGE